jgi:type I restriction enzyme S subunit
VNDNVRLPQRWATTTLAEIGEWCGGGTPSKENGAYWTDGSVPWVSPKDMKSLRISDSEDHISQLATQETNVKPFSSGTVLVVVRSGILARTLPVAVCDVPATMNQDLKGIKPFDGMDPLYVAYFMIGNERRVLHQCCKSGTTVASIEVPRLKAFPIRVPPTNEQRRIVAKIGELFSDLDAGVAALERIKVNLKRYRAAVLKAAVEGRLTEAWRAKHRKTEPASKLLERILAERRKKWEEDQLAKYTAADKTPPKGWRENYVEPTPPDTAGLPQLPEGWYWATVDQIAAPGEQPVLTGPFGSMLGREDFVEHGIPLLTIGCLTESGINIEKAFFVTKTKADELIRYRVRTGDLLFSRSASVGRIGFVDESLRSCS